MASEIPIKRGAARRLGLDLPEPTPGEYHTFDTEAFYRAIDQMSERLKTLGWMVPAVSREVHEPAGALPPVED